MATSGVEAARQVSSHTVRATAAAPSSLPGGRIQKTCQSSLPRDRPRAQVTSAREWSQKNGEGKQLHPVTLVPVWESATGPGTIIVAPVPSSSRVWSHQTHQPAALQDTML